MNKIYYIFFLLILSCSLNSNSTFWSKSKKIETDKTVTRILFEDIKPNKNEFNPKLKINLPKKKKEIIDLNLNKDGFTNEKVYYKNNIFT